jgi:hypothetical protein
MHIAFYPVGDGGQVLHCLANSVLEQGSPVSCSVNNFCVQMYQVTPPRITS